ncbi:putative ATP-binding protein (plasmid) [Roseomonas mucosa]|uniref:IS21-like element helper ATPase IstB n=1 Tax=Roseomonas TaxID=125216 RepID=UPI000C19C639|nr:MULTISPECIES: IS21-like element helper ATPase IstB [Roseomonas]ATR19160.1 transposase [Roseomonas sp. FDAARGOS_362]ATR20209.1 transposase [Roseomonas sp. FDAARGOS_362]UZO99315.1 putative ATP-binding protein [Roseomonas mucosa]
MLVHPTHERLIALGLAGMARGFEEQRRSPDIAALTFEERLGLLVDREAAERETRRLATRLKHAALRHNASIEDVDLRTPRGLDRALFQKLAAGNWIDRHEGLLVTGPTGVGKSWLACALAHKACRDGRRVLYQRVPRLFEALAVARGDGRHSRALKALARVELLVLDDWGLSVLTQPERETLLEILEDRHGRSSTILTSQVPVEQWHAVIGSPTLADAILDRLVHNAHRIELQGESMRRITARHAMSAQTLDVREPS